MNNKFQGKPSLNLWSTDIKERICDDACLSWSSIYTLDWPEHHQRNVHPAAAREQSYSGVLLLTTLSNSCAYSTDFSCWLLQKCKWRECPLPRKHSQKHCNYTKWNLHPEMLLFLTRRLTSTHLSMVDGSFDGEAEQASTGSKSPFCTSLPNTTSVDSCW